MKNRAFTACPLWMTAVLGATLLGGDARGADAQQPTDRELKKIAKHADRAFRDGGSDEAVELYQHLLDATSAGDVRRETALYRVGLSRLEAGDEGTARRHLDELAQSFPHHPRLPEIRALRSLLARIAESETTLAEAREELAAREAAFEAERAESDEAQAKAAAAEARAERAEGKVRALESQLSKVRDDLAKKEEAVERLLKVRAGRGSG